MLPVRKPADVVDLRQTTDNSARNEQTEAMAAAMPIFVLVLENARDMKHFGLFDLSKAFQVTALGCALSKAHVLHDRRENLYSSQGCVEAVIHFQTTMDECFASLLYKHLFDLD